MQFDLDSLYTLIEEYNTEIGAVSLWRRKREDRKIYTFLLRVFMKGKESVQEFTRKSDAIEQYNICTKNVQP